MASPEPDVARMQRDLPVAAFGPSFWFMYAANSSMMVAVSLLFVYADFVRSLGGTDEQLGRIVGVGMIGGILMRFAQGLGIDRYGAKHILQASIAAYMACSFLHLTISHIDGPAIYLLRIAYQSSLAGFFGASIAYVSGRAPVARMAEVIGTLGTSGFIGMMLGTGWGRYLVGDGTPARSQIDGLFLASAAAATLALVCGYFATRDPVRKKRLRHHPPLWWLLRRYNPGWILVVSVATGMGLNLPTVFLRPYMIDLNLPDGVMLFFWTYPPIAFVARISMRQVPDRLGIRPMIAGGMVTMVVGTLAFLLVNSSPMLLVPALFLGVAHASLFPAVVAGASGAFPGRWRGVGTTFVLAMFDVGTLCGSPLAGEILGFAERHALPRYTTMFSVMSALLALCGAAYFGLSRKVPERRGL